MRLLMLFVVLSLLGSLGCWRETPNQRVKSPSGKDSTSSPGDPATSHISQDGAEIVNEFGMTFVRMDIEPHRAVDSDPPFPTETYFIQKDEVSRAHLSRIQMLVKNRILETEPIEAHLMSSMHDPMEWRDFSNLAAIMSEYDPVYDYRLPTQSEWVFACMSGYKQYCAKKLEGENRPNAYGIVDMLDGDLECATEVGLLMGNWIDSYHTGHEKPACACKWWTKCNPDADDTLNEMIYGRLILVKQKINRH